MHGPGQQRRVSFAVSLLHAPDLMILDEPTVGVDPVLRQKVWQHLTTLTKSKGKTVIITTHYIEEARGADRVGFMRGGRLLAEGSPSSLMIQHSLSSLESVFLTLCVSDQYKKVGEEFLISMQADVEIYSGREYGSHYSKLPNISN